MSILFEYDCNGNIYLIKNDIMYMLSINKDDDIILDEVINKQYNDNNDKLNNNKFIDNNKLNNNLQRKIIIDALSEFDKNNLEEYTEEQIQEMENTYNDVVLNPEYEYYNKEELEFSDEDCYDDQEENKFIFHNNFSDLIHESKLLYDPVCYEVLLFEGNRDIAKLFFRSQLTNNQPFYRFSIYIDKNNIYVNLNIIGSYIKTYNINIDTLEIIKENNIGIEKFM